ncbi:replication protein P [Rahnella variigena]|uniref:replication protein P n=1 Tax=Rahnella variigena TaxID=574964 RepID=UPI00132F932E|nr:replication protein P [Rahnella variigena]
MKNIVTAIQQRDGAALQRMAGSDDQAKPAAIPEQAIKLFNELFRQLTAAFPAAMANIKSQEDLNELRRQWVLAFSENGINNVFQVNAGMAIARKQETPYLPSPGQFIAWCKQGALKAAGLPDEDELYVMTMTYARRRGGYVSAEAYPWTSSAAYWMVTNLCDHMRHENWSEAQLRKGCGTELKLMAKRIEAGEKIPAPVARIPQMSVKSAMSKGDGLRKCAELREKLGLKKANP